MAFKVDENGNITMVQGDTGRLVVNGLNTDKNYTIYFAIQDEKRRPVGNEVYIYADYHGTINDSLSISPAWLGRKIEIIEKNDQCNIYEDVVTGDIKVESNATEDNYGYIVLKIVA